MMARRKNAARWRRGLGAEGEAEAEGCVEVEAEVPLLRQSMVRSIEPARGLAF